jgi:type VI secretion system protein ImpA
MPLVSSRKHGKVSLRDIEISSGQAVAASGEARPEEQVINAAFAEAPLDELQTLQQSVTDALAALRSISNTMGSEAGPDAAPSFDVLSNQLTRIDRVLRGQLALRQDVQTDGSKPSSSHESMMNAASVGVITSRQDAIRALDSIAEFFRRNEPSSPIPLLLDRAKRLVSKSFLEVLADVAPDAVGQARAVGGLRQGE